MPIIVQNKIAYVVSRSEFLREYKKLDKKKESVLEQFSNLGFDFNFSVLAITELFKMGKKEHENDFNKRLYCFNFYHEDAQNIAMELIVFFSYFYHNVKVLDSENSIQPIKEYILPYNKFYFQEKSSITINDGRLEYTFLIKQITIIRLNYIHNQILS